MNTKTKGTAKKTRARAPKRQPAAGSRIIEGPEQAIAWTRGENHNVRITLVPVPEVDVRKVRMKMGLSQTQFATKFRISAGHAAQLGTGTVAPGRPHARPAGGDRQNIQKL
jgi:hypothetical protein